MRNVTFTFEGAKHTAYLDEENQWWREDGVHYKISNEKPSEILGKIMPLIRLRSDTVVRLDGLVSIEYDNFEDLDEYYYEYLGDRNRTTLVDGEAFLKFFEKAKDDTADCGWFDGEEFFVYKAFPMTPEASKAAWKAFFWQTRRECIRAALAPPF